MKYHRHKHNTANKKTNTPEKKLSDSFVSKEPVEAFALSTDAKGISRLEDGSIVFVEDLLPGEKSTVKIHAQKSTYKRATIVERENHSEDRAIPPCIYYMKCGGCQLQHIKPEKQSDYKIQWFFETLKRIGKWGEDHIKFVQKNFSMVYLKVHHYRRRIRLHFDGKNLGFNQSESNKIIAIDSCYIAREKLNEKILPLKNKLISIYNEFVPQGLAPHFEFDVELTESDDEKVVINIININSSKKTNSRTVPQNSRHAL